MKKLRPSMELRRSIGPVKLYRDDIAEIFETLRELSDKVKFNNIIIGEYQLSSVDELPGVGQGETQNFEVSCSIDDQYFSRFSVSVNKERAYISFGEDTPIARGVFVRLEKLLLSRRRRWHWVNSSMYFAWFFAISGAYLSLQGKVGGLAFLNIFGVMFSGIAVLIFLLYALTFPVRRSKIILVERVIEQSFWKKNKDKIVVALITALITAVLSILGTFLVQSISK